MEKELKITPPEGYQVDQENSTFEHIKFKPIKKKLPEQWDHLERIKGYQVDGNSEISGYTNN